MWVLSHPRSVLSALADRARQWRVSRRRYRWALAEARRLRGEWRKAARLLERERASLEAAREDKLAALQAEQQVRGENDVLRAQIDMHAKWVAREMMRLESETAMFAARKAVAMRAEEQEPRL